MHGASEVCWGERKGGGGETSTSPWRPPEFELSQCQGGQGQACELLEASAVESEGRSEGEHSSEDSRSASLSRAEQVGPHCPCRQWECSC